MSQCISTGFTPTEQQVQAECRRLAALSAADHLIAEVAKDDARPARLLTDRQRIEIRARVARYREEADKQAAIVAKERRW